MTQAAQHNNNVVRIVRPQKSGEQELESTHQLAKTLENIAADFRESIKKSLHLHRTCRMERTNLSMRLLFLDGQLNIEAQNIKKIYRLYRQAQNDFIAVKRAESERRSYLSNKP